VTVNICGIEGEAIVVTEVGVEMKPRSGLAEENLDTERVVVKL
jgi:hypothetical protein